jgi:hypothetical protein
MTKAVPPARSNKLVILGVVTLAVAPLALALFMYYGPGRGLLSMSEPHGQLFEELVVIDPLRPDVEAEDAQSPRWSLILAAPAGCGEDCNVGLDFLHRAQMALGKSSLRVQRVLLVSDHAIADDPPPAALFPPAAQILVIDQATWKAIGPNAQAMMLVADPAARLVLRYPETAGFTEFVDDLKHVLGSARH